ncbi:unnamed protein product [Ambrosiozyma monospora]|uniref:Unnamed protein product n=1 Tax=Ambrosiozyma monospora TaxID=43982 RepID=A0ACB5SRD0_AMBMO|nr:unnamed protein product [Ambrosiozyma monospora]
MNINFKLAVMKLLREMNYNDLVHFINNFRSMGSEEDFSKLTNGNEESVIANVLNYYYKTAAYIIRCLDHNIKIATAKNEIDFSLPDPLYTVTPDLRKPNINITPNPEAYKTMEVKKPSFNKIINTCLNHPLAPKKLIEKVYKDFKPDKPGSSDHKSYETVFTGIRQSYPLLKQMLRQSLFTGLTKIDLIDLLYYFPINFNFDSLEQSKNVIDLKIDQIPVFSLHMKG